MSISLHHNQSLDWESSDIDVYRDQPLGSGAYGIVCKAKYNHLPCAAKLLHPTFLVPGNWAVEKFMQECSFLASLKHPHIVQFLGVHTERTTGQAVLLMELMEESLTTFLKSSNQLVPLHIQVDICHDIALALHYLHSKGIIHRDLSSNNILLIGGCRAKITDFGMSKLTLNVSSNLSSLTQVPGCPVYMPPEAWINPPIYTERLDVFSFGVLILQISTRRTPNPGPSEVLEPSDASPTGYVKVPVPELKRRSEDVNCMDMDHIMRQLLLKCLQDKSDLRPMSSQICQSIESIKTTTSYSDSLSKSSDRLHEDHQKGSKLSLISDGCGILSTPDNEKQELHKKELMEKDEKIEKLTNEITKLTIEITELKNNLQAKEEELQKIQQNKSPAKEQDNPPLTRVPSEYESVCLSGLSPEVLSVISNDPSSSVPRFCIGYHDVARGEVSFRYFPEYESKEQTIKIFLQFYQHVFNSCNVRVGFIPIPSFFPQMLVPDVLKLCSVKQKTSTFKHIQVVNMVKVISSSPSVHTENIERIENLLNLRVKLKDGRTLTIKHGNIIDEDVAVIVSSANPPLMHRVGIAAAINAASQFEVQKHATEYVQKHGYVDIGNVACTRAGGNLKCDWVIHAVGPAGITIEDEIKEAKRDVVVNEMKALVNKILNKAEDLQAKSIAIPAISTGSLQLAVSIALSGIMEGIFEHKFASSSKLSDIRVTVMREEIFSKFAEIFVSHHLREIEAPPMRFPKGHRFSTPAAISFESPPPPAIPANKSSTSLHHSPSLPSSTSLASHVTYHMNNCKQQ